MPNFTLNSGTTAEKLAKTIKGLLFLPHPVDSASNFLLMGIISFYFCFIIYHCIYLYVSMCLCAGTTELYIYLETIRPIRTAENFEASNGRLVSLTKMAARWAFHGDVALCQINLDTYYTDLVSKFDSFVRI